MIQEALYIVQRLIRASYGADRVAVLGLGERVQLRRIVLLLDEPADATDQHGVGLRAELRAQRGDLVGADRAVRIEIDAVADRAHPLAQRAIAQARHRAERRRREPAEPLAE